MDLDHLLKETKERMQKALEHLHGELAGVRTGRANPSLLEEIKVNAYNTKMALRDLASINSPEPRLLIVQVWDGSNTAAVDKAIQDANLGFNPAVDGNLIRVPIPSLSEERRKEMVKLVSERTEEAKVAVRQIRREAIEGIEKAEKRKEISEDEKFRADHEVQKATDEVDRQIESLSKSKEAEVLQI